MIRSEEISVVVQGAAGADAARCLSSIRKYLPKAELILSTWEGTNTSGLDFDKLILSKDPGGVLHDLKYNNYNNVNRQLLSTQAGIKKSSRKYVLKIRTDFYLKNANFLLFFDCFPECESEFHFFKERVMVLSPYSREVSCENGLPTPFHPSDFIFFGLREDLEAYFLETPLMSEKDMASCVYKNYKNAPYESCTWKMSPEQYFCCNFFKKYVHFEFEDCTCWNKDNIFLSKNLLMNNFMFIDPDIGGFGSEKHSCIMNNFMKLSGLITMDKFINDYENRNSTHVDNRIFIIQKIMKHKKIVKSFRVCKYLESFLALLFYRIKFIVMFHKVY